MALPAALAVDDDGLMIDELSASQIESLLHSEVIGRIGCHDGDRTYVVPITYAYDGECVYGHSAAGLKVRMMRNNPAVCFEVEHVEDMAQWRSVIAWGTYEELRGPDATEGMQTLLDRLTPLLTSTTSQPSHGLQAANPGEESVEPAHGREAMESVIYRIHLTEKTGRYENSEPGVKPSI